MLSTKRHRSSEVEPMSKSTVLSSDFAIEIPEAVRVQNKWEAGQEFAFVPSSAGVLLVPVPTREELSGLAAGANPEGYRDRNDRY